MNERIIDRLYELDLTDEEIALINYMYNNGDITEEDIFDIGEDEEFNIENIENYELNESIEEYTDAVGTNVTYVGEDWYVFNNYEDAEDAAKEDVRLLIDDVGITGINFNYLGGMENFVDTEWFEDAERESFEFYCDDIATEGDNTYDNRLVQECYDAGLIDDSDFAEDEDGEPDYTQCEVDEEILKEKYVDYHMSQITDYVQEFIWNFGKDEFNRAVIDNNLIDIDALAEACVDADGPANSLARYDGNECETELNGTTYYLYRNN